MGVFCVGWLSVDECGVCGTAGAAAPAGQVLVFVWDGIILMGVVCGTAGAATERGGSLLTTHWSESTLSSR